MSLRETLEKNQKVVVPIALVAIAIGLYLSFGRSSGTQDLLAPPRWGFDLTTRQLVRIDDPNDGPFDTSGSTHDYGGDLGTDGSVVLAMIMTCGDATDLEVGMGADELAGVDAYVGWLQRNPQPSGTPNREEGGAEKSIISDVSAERWVPFMSQPGIEIQTEAFATCDNGEKPVRTQPI